MAECQQHSEGGEVAGAVAVTMAITENCGNSESPQILTELDPASFCESVLALLLVVLGIVLGVGGCALMGIRGIDRDPPEAAGPTTALAAQLMGWEEFLEGGGHVILEE
ncbi:hypothetical protein D623_10015873 [Myotis brandtii]|uniref:Uncharacterized protein n=1 Tax=Myotis brandtii TaxID=109478 RepID=S7MJZ3_MYOBR|nr:hypothetical protein D623_10015873 [Myotis brandtii]